MVRRAALVVMVVWLTGCGAQRLEVGPGAVTVAGPGEALWQACREEVVGRGFRLEVTDRRSGLIRSAPRTSCQWFELGCQDVVTGEDLLESSVQTVRRILVVEVAPAGEGFSVACRVELERLSAPREVVSGRVRTRDILGRSAGRLPGTGAEEEARWLPLGRDHSLEAAVLAGIEARLRGAGA